MASGRVIDSYQDHEFTDTMPFLQLFPSGRLVRCRAKAMGVRVPASAVVIEMANHSRFAHFLRGSENFSPLNFLDLCNCPIFEES